MHTAPLGPQPGPHRQAGRDHRHGGIGRPGDSRDRADRQAPQRLSAHADLVLPEGRRAAVPGRASCDAHSRRQGRAAPAQSGLRRADVPARRAVLHGEPDGQARTEVRQGLSPQGGQGPRRARQAHAALRGGLQAARLSQHVSVDVQPRQRQPGHRADREDHRLGGRHHRRRHPRGRRADSGDGIQGDGPRRGADLSASPGPVAGRWPSSGTTTGCRPTRASASPASRTSSRCSGPTATSGRRTSRSSSRRATTSCAASSTPGAAAPPGSR